MRILEIFDSLQGEGAWTGTPMTFVRLAGCNAPDLGLGCVRWCDTEASWDATAGEELTLDEILSRVSFHRVCLTGGEPLLQADGVAELTRALHRAGKLLHVESNGTLPLPEGQRPDWLTLSPKPPEYRVHPALSDAVDEFKLVVDEAFDPARAETVAALHPRAVLCLQPEASGGERSVQRAVNLVLAHPGWRLSLQVHKLLGLR